MQTSYLRADILKQTFVELLRAETTNGSAALEVTDAPGTVNAAQLPVIICGLSSLHSFVIRAELQDLLAGKGCKRIVVLYNVHRLCLFIVPLCGRDLGRAARALVARVLLRAMTPTHGITRRHAPLRSSVTTGGGDFCRITGVDWHRTYGVAT